MKITCNIIEDLLPLYVDDMVSEDSRKLVEEHLKECPACRKMQEEMMRENCLSAGRKDGNSAQINKTEAEPLKKIRRRIRKKRIFSVILAVALVAAAGGIGHYWYYDKENYISWDEANISVKDGKVYSTVSPLGRLISILSVDQKNMFYRESICKLIRGNSSPCWVLPAAARRPLFASSQDWSSRTAEVYGWRGKM